MKLSDLDIYLPITTSKKTSKQRVVSIERLIWEISEKQVILDTICYPVDNGEISEAKETPSYGVRLLADNTTLVNPKDGSIVDPPKVIDEANSNWADELMGQYDFLRALADLPTKLSDELRAYVQLAVTRGRYDI